MVVFVGLPHVRWGLLLVWRLLLVLCRRLGTAGLGRETGFVGW